MQNQKLAFDQDIPILRCECGHQSWMVRLNRLSAMTDDPEPESLICAKCGNIIEFSDEPESIAESQPQPPALN